MQLNKLRKISVVGCGVLGGSLAMSLSRCLPHVEVAGFAHRASTRRKVLQLGVVKEVTGNLAACVREADMVVLATPICTFEPLLRDMAPHLTAGCVVTDVGSTKVQVHQWARTSLPRSVHFIGSHPMAGSEQQGVEFARDDLFSRAACLVTHTVRTDPAVVALVVRLWQTLGCVVTCMTPARHDRVVANISHVPHAAAVALVNTSRSDYLSYAGKGFLDTSRIASGPANVWADIFLTNAPQVDRGIETLIKQLRQIQRAVRQGHRGALEKKLNQARDKRAEMIQDKLKSKELLA